MKPSRTAKLLGLTGATLALLAGCKCPRIYFAEGEEGRRARCDYAVLFLGAGFSEAELPGYREIVREYALEARKTSPFSDFSDRLCMLRMDLVSDPVDLRCMADADRAVTDDGPWPAQAIASALASSRWGRGRKGEVRLEAELCLSSDRIMWLTEESEKRAEEKTACSPESQGVIVVINADVERGGARVPVPPSLSLAVVGAPLNEDADGLEVTERGKRLFLHELAHIFGVLDEYKAAPFADHVEQGDGADDGEEHTPDERNVWVPWKEEDRQRLFVPCTHGQPSGELVAVTEVSRDLPACPPVPWLVQGTPPDGFPYGDEYTELRMCFDVDGSQSVPAAAVRWIPDEDTCHCPSDDDEPGLWVGGDYRETGCFRSNKCGLMRGIDQTCAGAGYGFGAERLIRRVICDQANLTGPSCPPEIDGELVKLECGPEPAR